MKRWCGGRSEWGASAVFEFEEALIGKTRVIRAIGDLGAPEAAEALAERLQPYCASRSVCIVVNWESVTVIKAPALVALRSIEELVTVHGGCLRHCGLSEKHRELLLYIRLKRDLSNVFKTEQEAIDSCGNWERSDAC